MISLLLALALLAESTVDPSSRPTPQPEFTSATGWLAKPKRLDFVWTYPDAAKASRSAGGAVMVCRVKPDGVLTDCLVEREWPLGLGFGQAAVEMRWRYRMDVSGSRASAVGKFVRVRVAWPRPSSPGAAAPMPRYVHRTPGPATR